MMIARVFERTRRSSSSTSGAPAFEKSEHQREMPAPIASAIE
jgi:hypothetical protein